MGFPNNSKATDHEDSQDWAAIVAGAAATGSRQLALQALLLDPFIHSATVANALLDDMLACSRRHMTQDISLEPLVDGKQAFTSAGSMQGAARSTTRWWAGVALSWDTLVDEIACRTEGILREVTDPEEACSILAERARGARPVGECGSVPRCQRRRACGSLDSPHVEPL
jgi:hypothetical protein